MQAKLEALTRINEALNACKTPPFSSTAENRPQREGCAPRRGVVSRAKEYLDAQRKVDAAHPPGDAI